MSDSTADFCHSRLREIIVEHVFIGDALRTLWRKDIFDVEVLRSEFDVRVLQLVVPKGSLTEEQQIVIDAARERAKALNNPVEIAITQL